MSMTPGRLLRFCLAAGVVLLTAPLAGADEQHYPYWSYDVGVGSGISRDGAFAELNAGLNTHILAWLTWRNSAYYRTVVDSDDYYGLDTSLLAGHRFPVGERASLAGQAGIGYRVTSRRTHAPFVEGGAMFRTGTVRIGASAKYIFYGLIDTNAEDDIVFNVTFAGRLRGTF